MSGTEIGGGERGRVASHIYHWEEPDVFCLSVSGVVTESDVRGLFEAQDRLLAGRGGVFWLADLGGMEGMTPEARAVGTKRRNSPTLGLAIYNATFARRVLVTLAVRGGAIMRSDFPPLHAAESEAEARAWIDAQRRGRARPVGS